MFILLISLALTNSFAASNMTLEVKQRIGAASAASASSSDSLSDEEAIDLLLELIMFVVDTIDETIDNITLSLTQLTNTTNHNAEVLATAMEAIDSLGNTTNHNSEVINDNFDSVKYWFIIVGVVSFVLFLATWIAIIVLFCRDPMRGWRGAEARPMTSYSN